MGADFGGFSNFVLLAFNLILKLIKVKIFIMRMYYFLLLEKTPPKYEEQILEVRSEISPSNPWSAARDAAIRPSW